MPTFGHHRYARTNELVNRLIEKNHPLIAAHRGTSLGSVVENTSMAVRAALREGADMVEIDVAASTDGDFFLFHDGLEAFHLGTSENLRTMTSAQIRALSYPRYSSGEHVVRIEELGAMLSQLGGDVLINVDRSWWYWPALLRYLDGFEMAPQLVLKSSVDPAALAALREHPVKYPFVLIVSSAAEIAGVHADEGINLVGVELIARDPTHEFVSRAFVDTMHDQGLFCLANAMNLPDRVPLFAGYDDEVSVFGEVEHGWGRLMDLGLDVIQTDWPSALADYRSKRR